MNKGITIAATLLAASQAAFLDTLKSVGEGSDQLNGSAECLACGKAFDSLDAFLSMDKVQTEVINFAIDICIKYKLGGEGGDLEICPGIVQYVGDVVWKVAYQGLLTRERICDQLLGFCKNPAYEHLDPQDYIDRVLSDKPEIIQNDDYVNNLYEQIRNDPNPRPTYRVVHMSDPHMDFDYTVGAANTCDSYICCRPEFGFPSAQEYQAGPFGSYLCDIPVWTV